MNKEVSKRVAKFKVNTRQAITRYLMITKPMHGLMNKQIELLVEILVMFTQEQGNFKRTEDTWKIIFNRDSMYRIRTRMDIPKRLFDNRLYSLRKAGIIKNNQVVPAYNPMITPDCKVFELTFRFELVDGS